MLHALIDAFDSDLQLLVLSVQEKFLAFNSLFLAEGQVDLVWFGLQNKNSPKSYGF